MPPILNFAGIGENRSLDRLGSVILYVSKRLLLDDENIARLQRVGVVPEQSHVVDTLRKAGVICHGAISHVA